MKQCEEGKNRVENLGEEVLTRGGEEERSLIQKFTVPTSSPPQILFTRRVQACGVTSVTPDSLRHLACQALLSVGFSRQEYWSGLPCPLAGDFPNQGIEPRSFALRQILYRLRHQGSPRILGWVAHPLFRGSSRPRN